MGSFEPLKDHRVRSMLCLTGYGRNADLCSPEIRQAHALTGLGQIPTQQGLGDNPSHMLRKAAMDSHSS